MLGEAFRIALGSFRTNRLRAVLSMVGIVIGVASVVAVSAIAESGTVDVRRQFEQFGLDAVQVFPGWTEKGPAITFDETLVEDIARAVPNVKAVLKRADLAGSLQAGRRSFPGGLVLVDRSYFSAMNASVDQGRLFDAADEYVRRPVTVLGTETARQLFPEGNPVGKDVMLILDKLTVRVQVIGVLNAKDRFWIDDWNRSAYLPYRFATGRIFGSYPPQLISVVAASRAQVVPLSQDLSRFFLEKTGDPSAVQIQSPQEWAEQNDKLTQTINLILSGIAAISLLVGGIGVMNIMLVSVAERKREIGIRKALGATPQHIRLQFLIEAMVLTLTGGVIGLAVGNGIAYFAVMAFHWTFVTSAGTALLAFGVSFGTGVFFGFYPAVRAARLDPVEALAAE